RLVGAPWPGSGRGFDGRGGLGNVAHRGNLPRAFIELRNDPPPYPFSACVGGLGGGGIGDDVADESESALVERANERMIVAGVAERAPGGADAGADRRLRDHAPLPNRGDQLVLAHDSITVPDEVDEQVEHHRLDGDNRAGSPQFSPREVDLEFGKTEG